MPSFLDCLMDNKGKKSQKSRKRKFLGYKVIQGNIYDGVVQGPAFLEYENGCTFKGEVESGDIKEGELIYPDGSIYKGKFMNGLPHGPGRIVYPNGTHLITTFKNGLPDNTAQITYENGDMYKGSIYKFKKHGFGKLFFKNGDKYIGDFRNG